MDILARLKIRVVECNEKDLSMEMQHHHQVLKSLVRTFDLSAIFHLNLSNRGSSSCFSFLS